MENHQSKPATVHPAPSATDRLHPKANQTDTALPMPPEPAKQIHDHVVTAALDLDAILLLLLSIFIVFLFIMDLMVLTAAHPPKPQFHVETLTLSNFNISKSNSLISGTWDTHFTIWNPDLKTDLSYKGTKPTLFYDSDFVSVTRIPPFEQPSQNKTAIRAVFSASSMPYFKVMDNINSDMNNGTIYFNIKMLFDVSFKGEGAHWSWDESMTLGVHCHDLSIELFANKTGGSLVGGPKKCKEVWCMECEEWNLDMKA